MVYHDVILLLQRHHSGAVLTALGGGAEGDEKGGEGGHEKGEVFFHVDLHEVCAGRIEGRVMLQVATKPTTDCMSISGCLCARQVR